MEAQLVPRVEAGAIGTKQASKRRRASTTASKKPAAKRAASTRNQPSSAIPATTRARARAKIGESSIDHAGDDQLTMSQFEPFAALAHRHTSAVKQLAKRKGGGS